MFDRLIAWIIKRLVFALDRHNDILAFSFAKDDRKEYSVLVKRYYEDHFTVGTAICSYPDCGVENGQEE